LEVYTNLTYICTNKETNKQFKTNKMENLKIGSEIKMTCKNNVTNELYAEHVWKITNITDKNVMYTKGTVYRTQYKTISIERISIKKLAKFLACGMVEGDTTWTLTEM